MVNFSNYNSQIFDQLSPFHIALNAQTDVYRAGPSMTALLSYIDVDPMNLVPAMTLRSQGACISLAALSKTPIRSLQCQITGTDTITLQGQSIPMKNGILLDLGLTLEEVTRIDRLPLHRHDFTPYMMIEELMLLMEAKSIVLNASQDLTLRLEHERNSALDRARRDPLTGLFNRSALDHMTHHRGSDLSGLCIMQMDLDRFKAVNDTLGHSAGDHVLRHVAKILRDETRRDDELIRLGGDEFTIVLHHICDRAQAQSVAQRIIERVAQPILYQNTHCHISASIGLATAPKGQDVSIEAMLNDADAALYAAKNAGRDQWRWADP